MPKPKRLGANSMNRSCKEIWEEMTELSKENHVRNYSCDMDMSDYLVETELFPKDVLHAYSQWNLEKPLDDELKKYFSDTRGGDQGDYRTGMSAKTDNVVNCLNAFPESKRALITVCNTSTPDHSDDESAKCMREIHFYLDSDNQLSANVLFRAQAALIFPKNVHFIGSLMHEIALRLNTKPKLGQLHYTTTILVSDRS